jgi:hypothetical protein
MSVTCGFAYLDYAGKRITAGQSTMMCVRGGLHQIAHGFDAEFALVSDVR